MPLKKVKRLTYKIHKEITPAATAHDELKFRNTYEKVYFEVLIDRLKTEVSFLGASAI